MNFRVNSFQSVATATGLVSRVQLPAAGRIATNPLGLSSGRAMPQAAATSGSPRGHLGQQRAQHRAQCRANCMSKANF
ncbi:hypothetical protein [Hymenobacter ruricola]|uniref:Uncharacterized protein n=1 Tax=Hymenobacter ruricola TaxID=2791023 RepID=A0ABS0HYE9_9BACT|nr:hypothetical protein [Hymenobacter ruricola]MBF9219561.1 hypothetical protein [Hymenobacter ruricola]